MRGIELSPSSAFVRPGRSALFSAHAQASTTLGGVLVGGRAVDADAWQVAIPFVRVEAIVIHGVSLPIGPWQDLIAAGDVAWPCVARVRIGQTLVVIVRNDAPELRELRVVLVADGTGAGRSRGAQRPEASVRLLASFNGADRRRLRR